LSKLPKKITKKIDNELLKYPKNQKKSAVMAALQFVQAEHGWLSNKDLSDVADYLEIPEIAVMEVATFYNMYDLKPTGKYKISICTNISCMLRGVDSLVNHIKQRLKIDFNELTKDEKFCLKESECMGNCDAAPMMVINNEKMYEKISPEKFDVIIKELK
jgi:NADH-quinone oxidoreductase subunit E